MTSVSNYWNQAKKNLSRKDKIIAKLIKSYESPSETILTSRKDIFYSLCKSIIGQQISVAAANSVFSKFKKKCNYKINAKNVSKLTFRQLKSCGLSRQKVFGIKSLAKQIINKSFNPSLIKKMTDEEAIELGKRAILHATHRDAYSGGINNVYHVKESGWVKVWGGDTNEMYYV